MDVIALQSIERRRLCQLIGNVNTRSRNLVAAVPELAGGVRETVFDGAS